MEEAHRGQKDMQNMVKAAAGVAYREMSCVADTLHRTECIHGHRNTCRACSTAGGAVYRFLECQHELVLGQRGNMRIHRNANGEG